MNQVQEENEIVCFYQKLGKQVQLFQEGCPNLSAIQHLALLIARSANRQLMGELTIKQELAVVGV